MVQKPIAEFKGEVFRKITVYPCVVRYESDTIVMEIPRREIGCLNREPCNDKECGYYIKQEEYHNCVLNIDRAFSCEEIGKIRNVSKQAVNSLEITAKRKFQRRIKRLTGAQTLNDLLPDPPRVVVRDKKTKGSWAKK